jgi:hypothetical protein
VSSLTGNTFGYFVTTGNVFIIKFIVDCCVRIDSVSIIKFFVNCTSEIRIPIMAALHHNNMLCIDCIMMV